MSGRIPSWALLTIFPFIFTIIDVAVMTFISNTFDLIAFPVFFLLNFGFCFIIQQRRYFME